MVRKPIVALFILAVCLVAVSCKKLGEPRPGPTGPLTFETVKFTDAIPKDYGPLIGVTQNPAAPGWAGLWFQRSDGTITAVFVNVDQGQIYQRALTIPRK
ncbi:MAG TPA: hypothetical protein VGR03_09870 [Candidatus Acidoferrum sp.]|nr:hypothetical protein [Candidatus Acidoferrum sp.]